MVSIRGRGFVLADLADETDALARQCLDQSLLVAGIADRAASRVDPVEQRGFRNTAPVSDRGQQFVLADHTATVLDQVNDEIEDLGLDRHAFTGADQFAALRIKALVFKQKSHSTIPARSGKNQACLKVT